MVLVMLSVLKWSLRAVFFERRDCWVPRFRLVCIVEGMRRKKRGESRCWRNGVEEVVLVAVLGVRVVQMR